MEKVVPKLKATGLPVVIYDPETWQDVLDNIMDLGRRLDMEDKARSVVKKAEQDVKALQKETASLPWLDLCIEWWPKPGMLVDNRIFYYLDWCSNHSPLIVVIVPCGKTYVNHVLSWVKVQNPFDAKYRSTDLANPPCKRL